MVIYIGQTRNKSKVEMIKYLAKKIKWWKKILQTIVAKRKLEYSIDLVRKNIF